jgi:hypothetical protein
VAIAALASGCGPSTFACEQRSECVRDQMQGRCEPTHRCSYQDATCPSGWRYGANAGEPFANACVEPEPPSTSTSDATSTSSGATSTSDATSTSSGATSTSDATSTSSEASGST